MVKYCNKIIIIIINTKYVNDKSFKLNWNLMKLFEQNY